MQAGLQISIIGHGAIIGWALFGAQLFSAEPAERVAISEVSVITEQEFAALTSTSPSPVVEDLAQLPDLETPEAAQQPEVAEVDTPEPAAQPQDVPAASEPEAEPDLSALAQPESPELVIDTPELAPQANDAIGETPTVPTAPLGPTESPGQTEPEQLAMVDTTPEAAPRIDRQNAPKPPSDADPAPEVQQETTPDPAAETEAQDQAEEAAPEQSATQIVTEADTPNPEAPQASARPRGRPSRIANMEVNEQKARERRAEAHAAKVAREAAAAAALEARKAEEAAARAAEAAAIEAALREAQTAAAADLGPPLTTGERGALVLAVQQCWNPPVGVQNDADLVVMLGVELKPDGSIASNPVLLAPAGTPQGTVKQAYEAGRRALIRCAPYALPRDKYEQWRQLEVVFNPQNMVVR